MNISPQWALNAVALGVGASLLMDAWNLILKRAFGIASAKTGNPAQARLKSLGTHVVFGIGLYLVAVVLCRFQPAA